MMAGRVTVRKQLSQSIGAGFGALTSGGREYYVLEHKNDSINFRAGQQKEIIVEYLELGRDSRCGVRYSEKELTVSRRHAAITKENGNWVLFNLSKTNPTLLNGRPVKNRYYITNGDEIQLSSEGPKLGFIIPSNNTTGSLGLGKRMTLFGEQALRPYKRALWAMGTAMVLIALLSGGVIYNLNRQNLNLLEVQQALQDTIGITEARANELIQKNEDLLKDNEDAKDREKKLRRRISRMRAPAASSTAQASTSTTTTATPTTLSSLYGDVYLIQVSKVKITQSNGEIINASQLSWQGTGFLTKDNRFVTARHVVEPWFYPVDPSENPDMVYLNVLKNNYGGIIELELNAVSSSGKRLTFKLKDFKIDRSGDISKEVTVEGQDYVLRHALSNPNDIAWAKIESVGNLETNPEKSANLEAARELYILGFPLGIGASDPGTNMSPIYSTSTVGRSGLENNTIITTNNSTDSGSSGGPVFIKEGNQYQVVGVVSGGWGDEIGRIVPISSIY